MKKRTNSDFASANVRQRQLIGNETVTENNFDIKLYITSA